MSSSQYSLWKLDTNVYDEGESNSTHNTMRSHHISDSNEFAETIKAIAQGKLPMFSSKMKSRNESAKKMYWEERRFNQCLDTPSSFDYACGADIVDHQRNWNKGCTFPKSKRALPSDDCSPINIVDSLGSPQRKDDVYMYEGGDHRPLDVYPFDTEVEMFTRNRVIHPFSKLRKKQDLRNRMNSSSSTYNQLVEESKVTPTIGPTTYILPDPWKKSSEGVLGYQRGSHQFSSKSSRILPNSSISSSSIDPRPQSQLDSVSAHQSMIRGSKVSSATISDVSFQPIRPNNRSIISSSQASRRKVDTTSTSMMGYNHLSTSSRASIAEDGSTMLDRLNLESLADNVITNDMFDDWKYLLSSALSPREQSYSRASKIIESSSDGIHAPIRLEAEKLPIGYDTAYRKPTTASRSLGSKRSDNRNAISDTDHLAPGTALETSINDDLDIQDDIIYDSPVRTQPAKNSPSHVRPLESCHTSSMLPSSSGHAKIQYGTWRGPVQKSKTARMLQSAEAKYKNSLRQHGNPIVETIWSESITRLPNLYYKRTSNSRGRSIRPLTTIASAKVADIMPLQESSIASSHILHPSSTSNKISSRDSKEFDTFANAQFNSIDMKSLSKSLSVVLDATHTQTTA